MKTGTQRVFCLAGNFPRRLRRLVLFMANIVEHVPVFCGGNQGTRGISPLFIIGFLFHLLRPPTCQVQSEKSTGAEMSPHPSPWTFILTSLCQLL